MKSLLKTRDLASDNLLDKGMEELPSIFDAMGANALRADFDLCLASTARLPSQQRELHKCL